MDTASSLQPILRKFASKVLQQAEGFAGAALAPYFFTKAPNGSYFILGDGSTIEEPPAIKRAPGSPFARSTTRLASDLYACELYGHEEPVGDPENKKYARPGAALAAATRRAEMIIMLGHEIRVQAMTTDASVPSAAIAVPWKDGASDPVGDVTTARNAIFGASALEANVIAMSRSVYEALKAHVAIKAAIKLSDSDARWPALLAALFDVDRLIVARAVVNNAQEGQAIQVSEIWAGSVVVAHVDTNEDFEAPSFLRTFMVVDKPEQADDLETVTKQILSPGEAEMEGVNVELYRQENISSTIVRAEQWTAEKLTAPGCGFVLKLALG
jgi:hypothetical protein